MKKRLNYADYAEAIALIVAVEQAQIRLLEEFHGVSVCQARGLQPVLVSVKSAPLSREAFTRCQTLCKIPLAMSADGIELASDVTLGSPVFAKSCSADGQNQSHLFGDQQHGRRHDWHVNDSVPKLDSSLGDGRHIKNSVSCERLKKYSRKGVHLRRNEQQVASAAHIDYVGTPDS